MATRGDAAAALVGAMTSDMRGAASAVCTTSSSLRGVRNMRDSPITPSPTGFSPAVLEADTPSSSTRKSRWLCHRYSLIGDAAVTENRRRHLKRALKLMALGVILGLAVLAVLPSPPAPQEAPLPPDPTCDHWERLWDSPAQVCSTDSEQSALLKAPLLRGFDTAEEIMASMSAAERAQIAREASDPLRDYPAGAAPAWRCVRANMRSLLVGPFRSRVQEWHSIKVTVPRLLRKGDRILRFTGGGVRADNLSKSIGYPPLHVHHLHVHHFYESHWFETHGDYLSSSTPAGRAAGEGGPWAYSLSSPPHGTCTILDADDGSITVDAQLNDVRFSAGTAMAGEAGGAGGWASDTRAAALKQTRATFGPGYEWYLRITFEVQEDSDGSGSSSGQHQALPPPCTPVHKLLLSYLLDDHALADPLMRFDAGNRETLFSWTLTLPVSGRMRPPAWLHAHRARYGGYLLMRGEATLPDLLGLGAGGASVRAALDHLRDALPPSNRTAAVRRILVERASRDGRLLCYDDPSQPSFVVNPESGDGLGGTFDRNGRLVCDEFDFAAGENLTAVYLSRPVWAAGLTPFPQHAQLAFYYTPDADAHGEPPPLVRSLLANSYGVMDLDGRAEGARSIHCVQHDPFDFAAFAAKEGQTNYSESRWKAFQKTLRRCRDF